MDKLATENLFLFEFLVDDVQLDEKCDCETPPGELCVSFQFLDNDPLDVCEADKKKKNDNTKSGKSCLFSLTADQIVKALEVFDVTVSVFKRMQPGWLPDKILVGEALISVANLFTELVENVESACDPGPAAKTLKDMFNLTDANGAPAGRVGVYIRMSCFGKLIVTQFQMNLDDKSVLFKDKGGQSLYRYKKAKKGGGAGGKQEAEMPCDTTCSNPCNVASMPQMDPGMGMQPQYDTQMFRNPNCPSQPCFDPNQMYPGMQQQQQMYQYPQQQQQQQQPQFQYGMQQQQMQMPQFNDYPPCCMPEPGQVQMVSPCVECGTLLPPQFQQQDMGRQQQEQEDPAGHYQEIGASMGGNALTIRVHKDKGKIEPVEGTGSQASCCRINTTCAPPKSSSTAKNEARYAVQPGVQQGDKNLPFQFKVSGNQMGTSPQTGNGNVVINPPVCSKPDGTKYTEISDPDKEVFVLRIGKKSEGVQKKANLELELCTPRGPEIKPLPKKETRDCQYDPSDCKGGDGGKKGKKGKKDKKGKGGKGKGKGKKKK